MNTDISKIAASIVTVFAAGVFSWTAVHALLYAPDGEVYIATSSARSTLAASSDDLPVRLTIPSLGIEAAVQSVGVNAKGNMASPSNFTDVGWYTFGTLPGERGSAVIDGHVDNGLGLAGVFRHLDTIQLGDDVFVETEDGKRLRFVVVEVETYSYKDVPTERLFSLSDAARLNLVTCEGSWVKDDKTYDRRLVVYTELRRD